MQHMTGLRTIRAVRECLADQASCFDCASRSGSLHASCRRSTSVRQQVEHARHVAMYSAFCRTVAGSVGRVQLTIGCDSPCAGHCQRHRSCVTEYADCQTSVLVYFHTENGQGPLRWANGICCRLVLMLNITRERLAHPIHEEYVVTSSAGVSPRRAAHLASPQNLCVLQVRPILN